MQTRRFQSIIAVMLVLLLTLAPAAYATEGENAEPPAVSEDTGSTMEETPTEETPTEETPSDETPSDETPTTDTPSSDTPSPPADGGDLIVLNSYLIDPLSIEGEVSVGADASQVSQFLNQAKDVYALGSTDETFRFRGGTTPVMLSLLWNTESGQLPESVDTAQTGTHTFTATAQPPEGYAFADGLEIPPVELTIRVAEEPAKAPLYWGADTLFMFRSGFSFAHTAGLAEIEEALTAYNFWLHDEDITEEAIPEIEWDLSDVEVGVPDVYTARGTVSLSAEDDVWAVLSEEQQTVSLPVTIRDPAALEFWAHSISSSMIDGYWYAPEGAENLSIRYHYCGTECPTAEELDEIGFSEDTDFACIDDDSFQIYFFDTPDGEGWYAFYLQAETEDGTLYSDYLLVNTDSLSGTYSSLEGDRNRNLLLRLRLSLFLHPNPIQHRNPHLNLL